MANKQFREMNRRERLVRFRRIAQIALCDYGLTNADLALIQYNENVIYKVKTPDQGFAPSGNSPFIPGCYALRIHAMDDQPAIHSEMTWMKAMSEQSHIAVPAPVETVDGGLTVRVASGGIPKGRFVTLLKWMKGRKLQKNLHPSNLEAIGKTVAHLHNFSANWQPPKGFSRPRWDWESQLGGSMFDVSLELLIETMPEQFKGPFKTVSDEAKSVMADLGEGPDAFGLIHSDLYPENVLFNNGQAYPVDFEDCGYGYWLWDIAVALCTWAWGPKWLVMREAFYKGYSEFRCLPEEQWQLLDLFIAMQYATMLLWASAFLQHDPIRRAEYEPWRDESGQKMLGYFTRGH
jgi:Ser/Thr protein kinase RdoA (MazF antagonist)